MLTHAELKAQLLNNAEVKTEYERLNREEFVLLDKQLKDNEAKFLDNDIYATYNSEF